MDRRELAGGADVLVLPLGNAGALHFVHLEGHLEVVQCAADLLGEGRRGEEERIVECIYSQT